jgi:hypothetical protein
MAELKYWQDIAKKLKGEIVVWINQTEALRGTNSEGVCNAMTREWIASFKSIRSRGAFFHKFWRIDAQGLFLPYSVPAEYIQKQDALQAETARLRRFIAWFDAIAADYKKKHPEDKKLIEWSDEQSMLYELRMRGGPGCTTYLQYDTVDEVLGYLQAMEGGDRSAFTLHMLKDGRGHALAFEFLPGKEKGEGHPKDSSYPALYQFLDPNTGWFAFDSFKSLGVFFKIPVMKAYALKKYEYYKIYEFRDH